MGEKAACEEYEKCWQLKRNKPSCYSRYQSISTLFKGEQVYTLTTMKIISSNWGSPDTNDSSSWLIFSTISRCTFISMVSHYMAQTFYTKLFLLGVNRLSYTISKQYQFPKDRSTTPWLWGSLTCLAKITRSLSHQTLPGSPPGSCDESPPRNRTSNLRLLVQEFRRL